MNFWKRYPADYRKKTSRLNLAMHGAYTLLLDEVYTTEAPLPADIGELYRICTAMTKDERAAVDTVAARYFPVGDDGMRHNERAIEELDEAAPAVAAARANGKKGGRPKKPKGLPIDNPAGIPAGSQGVTQTEPSPKAPQSPELPSPLRGEGAVRKRTARFDAATIPLPEWLDTGVWQRWCGDRKARGKAITEEGAKGQLRRLAIFRDEGIHTPEAVLEHAIESGNQGLFAPPVSRSKSGSQAKSFRERDADVVDSEAAQWGGGRVARRPAAAQNDIVEMEAGGQHGRIDRD